MQGRRQGRGNLKAFCVFCNERGHRKCMLNLGVLEDNQNPEKEAGKAVRELKLVPMMCKICDKHYGKFHRLYFKVSLILRTLKPDNSDDGGESDSSNLSNPVASVAIKVG